MLGDFFRNDGVGDRPLQADRDRTSLGVPRYIGTRFLDSGHVVALGVKTIMFGGCTVAAHVLDLADQHASDMRRAMIRVGREKACALSFMAVRPRTADLVVIQTLNPDRESDSWFGPRVSAEARATAAAFTVYYVDREGLVDRDVGGGTARLPPRLRFASTAASTIPRPEDEPEPEPEPAEEETRGGSAGSATSAPSATPDTLESSEEDWRTMPVTVPMMGRAVLSLIRKAGAAIASLGPRKSSSSNTAGSGAGVGFVGPVHPIPTFAAGDQNDDDHDDDRHGFGSGSDGTEGADRTEEPGPEPGPRASGRRFMYLPSTKRFAFVDDAIMRDPERAMQCMGVDAFPPEVPTSFASIQDLLYVYLAYFVREPRRPNIQPLRTSASVVARLWQRRPSDPVAGAARTKRSKQVRAWRARHGKAPNDSDADLDSDEEYPPLVE